MRSFFHCIIISGLLLGCISNVKGQSSADIDAVKGLAPVKNDVEEYHVAHQKHKHFSKAVYTFYKNFLSSQDGNVCTFYPSCSNYAMECYRRKGLLVATLATFDRISRCNGLSPEKYDRYKNSRYFYDPVR